MSRRKNADKDTPWGYQRVFIEDQNRYVFIANDITKLYQKRWLEQFGKVKYPTVKDCLSVHKGNNHIFSCDIQDAFGSIKKDKLFEFIGFKKEINFREEINDFVDIEINKELKKIKSDKCLDIAEEQDIFFQFGKYFFESTKDKSIDYYILQFFTDSIQNIFDASLLLEKSNGYGVDLIRDSVKVVDGKYKTHRLNLILKKNNLKRLSVIILNKYDSLKDVSEKEKIAELGRYIYRDVIKNYLLTIQFLAFEWYTELVGERYKYKNLLEDIFTLGTPIINILTNIPKHYLSRKVDDMGKGGEYIKNILENKPCLNIFTEEDNEKEKKKKRGKGLFLVKEGEVFYWDKKYYNEDEGFVKYGNSEYLSLLHNDGSLIQGSKTSPAIFEIFCIKTIDKDIKKYCEDKNIIYSRYRDDLIFSSNKKSIGRNFRKKIRKMLLKYDFYTNPKKNKIINLNMCSVELLGVELSFQWNMDLTKKQKDKKKKFQELGITESEIGMEGWKNYIDRI